MAFEKDRIELNQSLKRGIHALQQKENLSYTDIGHKVGYPNGDMISQIVKHDPDDPESPPPKLPGPVKLMRLSVLLSEHGLDETADLFSAPEKKAVLADPAETSRDDLCPADEVRFLTESAGLSSALIRSDKLDRAEEKARHAISGGWALLEQIAYIREVQHVPGDGLATSFPTL